MAGLVARAVQGRTGCSQLEGHWRAHMCHTLGQEEQRLSTWVLAAEEWKHRDCTYERGRVRRWQGPWELRGVKELMQKQALAPERMTQWE